MEYDDEVAKAALNLCFMKQKKISKEEASTLGELILQQKQRNSPSATKNVTDFLPGKSSSDDEPIPSKAAAAAPPVESLREEIGSSCYGRFQKKLATSDTKKDQGRLLVLSKDVQKYIFPLVPDVDGAGIRVSVYDGEGKKFNMGFKKWASNVYVFNGQWNEFRNHHNLEAGDSVEISIFKDAVTQRFFFVMTPKKVQA